MREHGSKLPAEQPGKVLKSLLKKPGQSKTKSQKNRVVINEKLNEFFAADYIILIKEVCCADYEEDCDCCCQEYELIRLGNCKECRAELNLRFGVPDNSSYENVEKGDEAINERTLGGQNCGNENYDLVELHLTESEDVLHQLHNEPNFDETADNFLGGKVVCIEGNAHDNSIYDENDVSLNEGLSNETEFSYTSNPMAQQSETRCYMRATNNDVNVSNKFQANLSKPMQEDEEKEGDIRKDEMLKETDSSTTASLLPDSGHQHETLSPPEGYKDVCSNQAVRNMENSPSAPVGQCDYSDQLHSAAEDQDRGGGSHEEDDQVDDIWEKAQCRKINTIGVSEEFYQEVPHRYLVETITMTTVTERRIVREISEEEGPLARQREMNVLEKQRDQPVGKSYDNGEERKPVDGSLSDNNDYEENTRKVDGGVQKKENLQSESIKELSLVFKLGNSSLMSNSLKPNSAVRQLFPNPKFISSPPTGKIGEEALGNRAFLNIAKYNDSVEEELLDVDQDDSLVRKTIGRNTLRRSLIENYRTASRKKTLKPQNLSLEERIRQLTCVDQEEENQLEAKLTNQHHENNSNTDLSNTSMTSMIRTSPPGEEGHINVPIAHCVPIPKIMNTVLTPPLVASTNTMSSPSNIISENSITRVPSNGNLLSQNNITNSCPATASNITRVKELTESTSLMEISTDKGANYNQQNISVAMLNAGTQTHNQSTYKKMADLFIHKKGSVSGTVSDSSITQTAAVDSEAVLPDLGISFAIGSVQQSKNNCFNKECQGKPALTKTNTDVRKQLLASLAPLSCMAGKTADNHDGHCSRHNEHSKLMVGINRRDSVSFNSQLSYSIEDIEVALAVEENRRYSNPPDVTRGTPVGTRLDIADNATDELIAFVEQDKPRIERIKRRYEFEEDRTNSQSGCFRERVISFKESTVKSDTELTVEGTSTVNNSNNAHEATMSDIDNIYHLDGISNAHSNERENHKDTEGGQDLNDDDELNDYGFNRRPSVRGIKHQQSNSEEEYASIVRKTSIRPSASPTCFHEKRIEVFDENIATDDETAISSTQNSTADSYVNAVLTDERDANTINRINTMQKQIDDIYQTIAETAISTQHPIEPETYLQGTINPRIYGRSKLLTTANNAPSAPELFSEPRNVRQYLQEQQLIQNDRIVRAVNVCSDDLNGGLSSNDGPPQKSQRHDPISSVSGYPIETLTSTPGNNGRCYRTMYFVPYNGVLDPTYQNVQRGSPQYAAPNYGTHVERYPYPRLNQTEQHYRQQQHHYQYHVPSTQSETVTLIQPPVQTQSRSQNLPQVQNATRYYAANHAPLAVGNQPTSSSSVLLPVPADTRLSVAPASNPVSAQPTVHVHLHHNQTPNNIQISNASFQPIPYDRVVQLHDYQQHKHQHHRHRHQTRPYRLQTPVMNAVSTSIGENTSPYTVIAPTRCIPYPGSGATPNQRMYHVHLTNSIGTPTSEILSHESPCVIPLSSAPDGTALPFDQSLSNSSSSCSSSSSSTSSVSSASSLFCSLTASSSSSSTSSASFICSSAVCSTSSVLPVNATNIPATRRGNVCLLPGKTIDSTCTRTEYNGLPGESLNGTNASGVCDDKRYSLSNDNGVVSTNPMQIPESAIKLQHNQVLDCYAVSERGVPEGAASASPHDRSSIQSFIIPKSEATVLLDPHTLSAHNSSGKDLPPHAQNSIYYAMNV